MVSRSYFPHLVLVLAISVLVVRPSPTAAQSLFQSFLKPKPTAQKSQPVKKKPAKAAKRASRSKASKRRTVTKKQIVPTSSTSDTIADRVNDGRLGIISGGIGGTYIRIASDLAAVLNDEEKLRILPIIGQGSVQNITDILYLKGVDVGIVQSDVLAYIKRHRLHSDINKRIQYVTKLYNEEFHLIGGREISNIRDLAGKTVNFGVKGSGSYMTASTVFEKLGIKVKIASYDQALAIEKIRNGEISATVFVAGKPAQAVTDLKGAYGLQLIPIAYDRALQDAYLPARFSSEDYPDLVPAGGVVNSIAVGAVMAVYNWPSDSPRRKRVKRFVDAFFSRISDFQVEPRHKKWREVNLAAKVPGWKRFSGAKRWLSENKVGSANKLKVAFNAFLDRKSKDDSATPDNDDRESLFQKFLKWQEEQN